jgi:hypothetical protein
MFKTVFHGGPPEEDPVSEERSDLLNKEKEKYKFVLFIQKLLIIYRGSLKEEEESQG